LEGHARVRFAEKQALFLPAWFKAEEGIALYPFAEAEGLWRDEIR
jgi:hypothetical protein